MSNIEEDFNISLEKIKLLVKFTNLKEKAILYKYYKQATEGDINYDKPKGIFNIIAIKKWEEWNTLKGTEQHIAKKVYAEFVNKLENKYTKQDKVTNKTT